MFPFNGGMAHLSFATFVLHIGRGAAACCTVASGAFAALVLVSLGTYAAWGLCCLAFCGLEMYVALTSSKNLQTCKKLLLMFVYIYNLNYPKI